MFKTEHTHTKIVQYLHEYLLFALLAEYKQCGLNSAKNQEKVTNCKLDYEFTNDNRIRFIFNFFHDRYNPKKLLEISKSFEIVIDEPTKLEDEQWRKYSKNPQINYQDIYLTYTYLLSSRVKDRWDDMIIFREKPMIDLEEININCGNPKKSFCVHCSKNKCQFEINKQNALIEKKKIEEKREKELLLKYEGVYLYFLVSPVLDRVKIGVSKTPIKRKKRIESATGLKLNLYSLWANAGKLEKQLHKKFKEYRIRGEWFEFSDEIKKYISNEAQNQKVIDIKHLAA